MRKWLSEIPGAFYLAAIFVILGLWSQGIQAFYIAAACAAVGAIQVGRQK